MVNYPDGRVFIAPSLPLQNLSIMTLREQRTIEIVHDAVLIPLTELPLPPRINTLYDPYEYTGKNGKKQLGLRLSAEGRRYKALIAPMLHVAMRDTQELIKRMQQDKKRMVYIHSSCFFNANRTDVDACLKALQDALLYHLGMNDNRVIQHNLQKYVIPNITPGVIVKVVEARWSQVADGSEGHREA